MYNDCWRNCLLQLDRYAALPAIQRHADYTSPRRDVHIPGSNRINTRDVASMELSILTKDLSTVKLSPQAPGSCTVTSYPDGLGHVYNTDIKELNIRVENKDGSYSNIVAVPKHNV